MWAAGHRFRLEQRETGARCSTLHEQGWWKRLQKQGCVLMVEDVVGDRWRWVWTSFVTGLGCWEMTAATEK